VTLAIVNERTDKVRTGPSGFGKELFGDTIERGLIHAMKFIDILRVQMTVQMGAKVAHCIWHCSWFHMSSTVVRRCWLLQNRRIHNIRQ
jgi:hypothetical protein